MQPFRFVSSALAVHCKSVFALDHKNDRVAPVKFCNQRVVESINAGTAFPVHAPATLELPLSFSIIFFLRRTIGQITFQSKQTSCRLQLSSGICNCTKS